jgi:hypothetical protein
MAPSGLLKYTRRGRKDTFQPKVFFGPLDGVFK